MKNIRLFQKPAVILGALVATVFALAIVSCNGLLENGSSLTVSLPTPGRAIDPGEVAEIRSIYGSWSVSVVVDNGAVYEKYGNGPFTFGNLPIGSTIEVTVKCLSSDGELLAYAKKSATMEAGPNVVSINMSRDGVSIAALEREKHNNPISPAIPEQGNPDDDDDDSEPVPSADPSPAPAPQNPQIIYMSNYPADSDLAGQDVEYREARTEGQSFSWATKPDSFQTPVGYSFAGWREDRNGSGTLFNPGSTATITYKNMTGDITIYAQWTETERSVLYVSSNGNNDNDGSDTRPYLTLERAVVVANQSGKDNVTIHIKDGLSSSQSTGAVSDGGTLQDGKTYTLRADSKNVTVNIGSGITVGNGVTLILENITLTGSGGLGYVVGATGGTVSLNNAHLTHTGTGSGATDPTDPSKSNNSAVSYTGGILSMQGDSRITKVNMSTKEDLQITIPAEITANEKTILFASQTYLYGGAILTGDGVSSSHGKFTVGYASVPSGLSVDEKGQIQN